MLLRTCRQSTITPLKDKRSASVETSSFIITRYIHYSGLPFGFKRQHNCKTASSSNHFHIDFSTQFLYQTVCDDKPTGSTDFHFAEKTVQKYTSVFRWVASIIADDNFTKSALFQI
jgi:hypothetical protein